MLLLLTLSNLEKYVDRRLLCFFSQYYLTLFKQGKPPIRPALYRESIFSRRLLFIRVMDKKELANIADCESGKMQFLQSVLMVFRCCVSTDRQKYLADAGRRNFSSFASISKTSSFYFKVKSTSSMNVQIWRGAI